MSDPEFVEARRASASEMEMLMGLLQVELPPPVAAPCNECPWRRDSMPGHLGPHSAEEWTRIAHGEGAIACHKTIPEGSSDRSMREAWEQPGIRQCAGAATFRNNVCKSPRNPTDAANLPSAVSDKVRVFSWDNEFVQHHHVAGRRGGGAGA